MKETWKSNLHIEQRISYYKTFYCTFILFSKGTNVNFQCDSKTIVSMFPREPSNFWFMTDRF